MHKRPVQELEAKEWPTSMKIRQEHCEILVRLRLVCHFTVHCLGRDLELIYSNVANCGFSL